MDRKQMRLLLSIPTEGSLIVWPNGCHMTHPPLTRQIAGVSRPLCVPLAPMELTETSAALLEEVAHVLALAQREEECAPRAGSGDLGRL